MNAKNFWGKGGGAVVACKEYLKQRWRGSNCVQRVPGVKVEGWWLHTSTWGKGGREWLHAKSIWG